MVLEQDFQFPLRKFWANHQMTQEVKVGLYSAREKKLLILTGDINRQRKEHFDEFLNPASMSSEKETEFEHSEDASLISLPEVTEVVKKLLCSKVPGDDEIHPEMLKFLDIAGLSWLTSLLNVTWRSEIVPVDWLTGSVVSLFKKGNWRVCSSFQPPWEILCKGTRREAPTS